MDTLKHLYILNKNQLPLLNINFLPGSPVETAPTTYKTGLFTGSYSTYLYEFTILAWQEVPNKLNNI